jgi:hypothetical protein
MTWPDLTLSLGKVQNLLKRWATDSRLSSTFRRRTILSGEILRDSAGRESLGMFGRSLTNNSEFSPLLSWQTTWKKHISTTISANYTLGSTFSFLNEAGTNRSEVNSATRGLELSLTYSFSAPQGIKLPFLRKVRFSSDLSVSWSVRYANTLRRQRAWLAGVPETWTAQQDDNSVSTTLGASYRFSRSIEAGLNTGYSRNKGLAPTTTETMDLDIWVLFRF